MKTPRNRNRNELYLCVGENFKDNAPIGYCGDVKSLMDWVCLLSRRTEEEMNIFFDSSYTNNDVVYYILRSWGKRLEPVKKGR